MDEDSRPKKQSLYRCPGWGRRRSLQVTMDHNTTTTGQSFHLFVTIIYVKHILFNLHTVFLSLYRYSTYPSIHSQKVSFLFVSLFLLYFFPFIVNFLNSSFTTFPSTQVCFCDLLQLLCSSLGIRVLICSPFLQPGLASHPKKFFLIF